MSNLSRLLFVMPQEESYNISVRSLRPDVRRVFHLLEASKSTMSLENICIRLDGCQQYGYLSKGLIEAWHDVFMCFHQKYPMVEKWQAIWVDSEETVYFWELDTDTAQLSIHVGRPADAYYFDYVHHKQNRYTKHKLRINIKRLKTMIGMTNEAAGCNELKRLFHKQVLL